MTDVLYAFDLQLFAEEADTVADSTETAETVEQEQAAVPPADNQKADPVSQDKTGTILGGKEEETAWDFKGLVPDGMEYNEAAASAYSEIAKEAGLTGEQANKLAAYGMRFAQETSQAVQQAWLNEVTSWGETTKQELGSSYEAIVRQAGTGIEALERAVPGIREALNETGAGNRVELVRAFAAIGSLVGEDAFRGFGTSGGKQSTKYPNTNFDNY